MTWQERQNAMALAMMDDASRENYQAQINQQQRRQGAARLGAGAIDYFGGRKAQKEAESQIEELGGQADAIREQLQGMKAPGSMDSNTVAEATRDAAILGFQSPAEDPANDLAAQAMALESGADPSKLYAAAAQQDSAQDAQRRAESQQQFQSGLQMAQQDALNRFKQEYSQKASELDQVNQELAGAQEASLMAQQRKARGTQVGLAGAGQFAQSGGLDEIKSALGGKKSTESEKKTETETTTELPASAGNIDFSDGQPIIASQQRINPVTGQPVSPEIELPEGSTALDMLNDFENWDKRPVEQRFPEGEPKNQAHGGSVQQTPGVYDHDTNDMILMAQGKDGMLIDTGIRQTGGEYVIDPFDAGNMRQSHEKIDPMELEAVRTGRAKLRPELIADLMQLYDAVRFINEPQFKDDYYEKKMNGYG